MNLTNPKLFSSHRNSLWRFICLVIVLTSVVLSCRQTIQKKITVLGEDSSNTKAMESLKDDYQKATGVEVQYAAFPLGVLGPKANQDLANGTGLYDIIMQYNFALSPFARNGWVFTVEDLEKVAPDFAARRKEIDSDIFPRVWREVGYYRMASGEQPKAIGYPFAASSMILVYNKKMFDDSANRLAYRAKFGKDLTVPTSWDQFRQIAQFFTVPAKSTYGVALQGGKDGWLYYEWCNFAYSMGGGVMRKDYGWEGDASTPLLLDSPETIKATEFYVGLKPFNAGDYFSTGAAEQRELMKKGNVAMAIMWSGFLNGLLSGPDDQTFGFAPIPGSKSMLSGGTYFVNKSSKNPQAAAQYILFMLEKSNQVTLMTRGLTSVRKSVYDDPLVQKIPYANALRQSLDRGVYMAEAGPDADAILQVVTTAIQQVWRGQSNVKAALTSATTDLQARRSAIFAGK